MSAARITVAEQVAVAASPDLVWLKITDPNFIVTCIPGARVIDEHDGVVDGALEVRLGPTVVNFLGTAEPEYDHEAHRGKLIARGGDKGGRTKAQSNLTFDVQDAPGGTSLVVFDGDIELAGGLAGFLQTGGAHMTKRMMKDFGEQLATRIEAEAAVTAAVADEAADAPITTDPPARVAPPATVPINGFKLATLALLDWLRGLLRRGSRTR
jgi:carbon monoxide dehydrogenase subunit G